MSSVTGLASMPFDTPDPWRLAAFERLGAQLRAAEAAALSPRMAASHLRSVPGANAGKTTTERDQRAATANREASIATPRARSQL